MDLKALRTLHTVFWSCWGLCSWIKEKLGTVEVQDLPFFDTVKVKTSNAHAIADAAIRSEINLRVVDGNTITVAFDETTFRGC